MRVSFSSAVQRVGVVTVHAAAMLLLAASSATSARGAVIGASFNEALPSTLTTYPVNGGGGGGVPNVTITEDVAVDFSSGNWLKDLVNATAGGFSSGQNRLISEVLTNVGQFAWTGWNEHVVSRTDTGGGPQGSPGFLFDAGSLVLSADYGSGTVALTEGVDYTITTVDAQPAIGSGPGPDWEAITITFAPNRVIEPGDILNIQKDIFEVFGDGNIWQQGEAARIGEYPIGVPEPGAVAMLAIVVTAGVAVRRGRASRR